MTKEQTDTAFKLMSELAIAAKALEQYGNARLGGIIRRTSDLLEQMVAEAEAKERTDG